MTRTLRWSERANHDLARMPADVSERIVITVDRWAATGHGDFAPLRNVHGATHRLRVGRMWRVLLSLDEEARTATVRRVLARGAEYRP